MEFGKETIEKIEQLVRGSLTVEVGGKTFTSVDLRRVIDNPRPNTTVVHNLRGFCGFINNDIDKMIDKKASLIVVNGPKSVDLISAVDGEDVDRTSLVSARLNEGLCEFPFGRFMGQEEFAIAFRSLFVSDKDDDFEYVLSYSSKLKAGNQVEGKDDGITQRVNIKKGASGHLSEQADLKPIVKLTPYRTFREAKQPESEFLLRVRMSGEVEGVPFVALYEADGGAWVNQATQNVVDYIQSLVTDIPVIA